jgi:hypothetical protein
MKTSGSSATPNHAHRIAFAEVVDDIAKILIVIPGDHWNTIESGLKDIVPAARDQASRRKQR